MLSAPTCKSLWGILLVQHSEESDDELDSGGEGPAHPGTQLDAPRAHLQPDASQYPSFALPSTPEEGPGSSEENSVDTSASVADATLHLSLAKEDCLQPLATHVDAIISSKLLSSPLSGGSIGTATSQHTTHVSQDHVASTTKELVLPPRARLSNGTHGDSVD